MPRPGPPARARPGGGGASPPGNLPVSQIRPATNLTCELEALAVACNPTPRAMACSEGVLVYGSAHSVMVVNTRASSCVYPLPGHHNAPVEIVKFSTPSHAWLATAGTDGSVGLWKVASPLPTLTFQTTLPAPASPSDICVLELSPTRVLLSACTSTGVIHLILVTFSPTVTTADATISLTRDQLPQCIAALASPSSPSCTLAIGGADNLIRLYDVSLPARDAAPFPPVATLRLTLSGHEDWVRSVEFVAGSETSGGGARLASASQDGMVRVWTVEGGGVSAEHFEALLVGHEDWVVSVGWSPAGGKRLLSAGMDHSLLVWEEDAASGVWVDVTRASCQGEGFVACAWGEGTGEGGSSLEIWGVDRSGAVHCYRRGAGKEGGVEEEIGLGGHLGAVTDLAWGGEHGEWLATCGLDMTTRVWATQERGAAAGTGRWHEIARAQTHGHALRGVTSFIRAGKPYSLVVASDEKCLRVLEAAQPFYHWLTAMGVAHTPPPPGLPAVARQPPLGLSNKPLSTGEHLPRDPLDGEASPAQSSETRGPGDHAGPPTADTLARDTLWAEMARLYGHPNDCLAVASHPQGRLVASSSRATIASEASVRVWDTTTWVEVACLPAMTLSAVQLAFSPSGRRLVAVGRDRSFAVWEEEGVDEVGWKLLQHQVKAHSRIIWSVTWLDEGRLVTGSRDGLVRVWRVGEAGPHLMQRKYASPVTAVATTGGLIAIGLENGVVGFARLAAEEVGGGWSDLGEVPPACATSGAVLRLAWRPGGKEPAPHILAAAGQDGTVRIMRVNF